MNPESATPCWALTDGAAGNQRQALALARALGLEPRLVDVRLREPWNLLAPRLATGASWAIRDAADLPLAPPWPGIAIGCGRRAALATRVLRDWSGGRCRTVQILDPRIDPRAFDLVIAPQHDRVSGDNVIESIGALNPVDAPWLAAGCAAFAFLARLPQPRVAVLVGGSTRAHRLDGRYVTAVLERLASRHSIEGGSFLVSVSRRTPVGMVERLRAAFREFPGCFWGGPADGVNPYAGFLGWADRVFVTPDSVNMISEACATGKPVYTFMRHPLHGKLAAFHAELRASGHVRGLDDSRHLPQPPALAETAAIAELVRARLGRVPAHPGA